MKHSMMVLAGLGALGLSVSTATASEAMCPYESKPAGFDATGYFQEADRAALQSFAACLEAPDPALRDGFAYEAIVDAMRSGEVPEENRHVFMETLLDMIETASADEDGFRGPFAILALAEVARTDRIEPWLSAEERHELAMAGHDYLASLEDYRGYDAKEGWRHGVAHTADLFLQLALNPELDSADAKLILEAIGDKLTPTPTHAYTFGETTRLARPVLYLALGDHLADEEWQAWFDSLHPGEDGMWEDPYKSYEALAAIHNLRAFAMEIHLQTAGSETPNLARLAPMAVDLVRALP